MGPKRSGAASERPGRGWPRAAALLAVALSTAVVSPSVLVAVPFIVVVSVLGLGRPRVLPAVGLAVLMVASGWPRDGVWYVERAWALMVGGAFAAATLLRPAAATSARALAAVLGACGVAAGMMGLQEDAWRTVDWAVSDYMATGVSSVLSAVELVRPEALSPAFVTAIYQTIEVQASVFPAMLLLASMAALGLAWWLYVRLAEGSDQGLGPLRDFRFNDHLVWVFIDGLILLVTRWAGLGRVGSNAVVFMGALYALRGAAVLMFLSGGMSLLSYLMLALGLLVMPPLILGAAMVVGLGDTWLGFRTRASAPAP